MAQSFPSVKSAQALPDEKEVREWLGANKLEPVSPWFFMGVMAMMGLALFLGLLGDSPLSSVLAVVMTVALMGVVIWRAQRVRLAEDQTRRVHELTVTRQWEESFNLAWFTLAQVKNMPEQYARTLACMAYDLDQMRQYDAALVAYRTLLETLPGDHPFVAQVQTHMAMALLSNDQLADADDRLRKLRLQAAKQPPPVKALIRLADLIQMARTYHFSDVIELEQGAREMFRPLGVDAGYAYALMAYARDRLAFQETDETAKQAHDEAADRWWQMATLLVSPQRIVERFGALSVLLRRPSTPSPVWVTPAGTGGKVGEAEGMKQATQSTAPEAFDESDPRSIT